MWNYDFAAIRFLASCIDFLSARASSLMSKLSFFRIEIISKSKLGLTFWIILEQHSVISKACQLFIFG